MLSDFAQLDWDNLRVFLAIARTGRLTSAARRLQVEHTTVSRRLAALERQLGAPLFFRTIGGYMPTPVGKSVLANAEVMERAALALGVRARESLKRLAGLVRLGIPPEFASEWLAPRLPEFRRRYPEIALQVLVGTRTLDLSRGEADIAIRTPRPEHEGLVTVRIAKTTLGLYASRSFLRQRRLHIEDAKSARGLPLMVYTRSLPLLQNVSWFRAAMGAANVVLETNGTHALLAAARADVGIAVLPRFVARNYEELVPVSPNVGENDLWLVTHSEFRRDPGVRATADFLKLIAAGPGGLS